MADPPKDQIANIGDGQTTGGDGGRAVLSRDFTDTSIDDLRIAISSPGRSAESFGLQGARSLLGDPTDPFNRPLEKDGNKWGPTVQEGVEKAVYEGMTPLQKKEYEEQRAAMKAENEHRMLQANINGKPLSQEDIERDYPAVAKYNRDVKEMEKTIQMEVLKGMSPEDRKELGKDMSEWKKQVDDYYSRDHGLVDNPPKPPASVEHYFDKIRQRTAERAGHM